MNKKELKEMSKEDLLTEIKAASDQELNIIDETLEKEQHKQKVLDDFAEFTKLVQKYKKIQTQMQELIILNKDNEELQKYVKYLDKLAKVEVELDDARKGYLYESAILSPETELENKDVKISLTMPYDKEEFDKAKFIKDYGPETEMYQKYMVKKSVKGNVKFKIKE